MAGESSLLRMLGSPALGSMFVCMARDDSIVTTELRVCADVVAQSRSLRSDAYGISLSHGSETMSISRRKTAVSSRTQFPKDASESGRTWDARGNASSWAAKTRVP